MAQRNRNRAENPVEPELELEILFNEPQPREDAATCKPPSGSRPSSMTYASDEEYKNICDPSEGQSVPNLDLRGRLPCIPDSEEEESEGNQEASAHMPKTNYVSSLMLELIKCRRVFTGKFMLQFCSADVSGQFVGGNMRPDKYLPTRVIRLHECRATKTMLFPEMGAVCKKTRFAVIVFVSRYEKHYMMDASWAQFRHLMFSMCPTPCALQLYSKSWAYFLRPGDSGIEHIAQLAPPLFQQLEGMPVLYMVLFKKCLALPPV